MRVLRRFTAPDLCVTSGIKTVNVQRYLRYLAAAGYLRLVRENVNGLAGSYRLYQLIRDTGPHAPIPWSERTVYDPNVKRVFGEEVADG